MQNDFFRYTRKISTVPQFKALKSLKNKLTYNINFSNKEINETIHFINIIIIN